MDPARRLEALDDVHYFTARSVPDLLSQYESFLKLEASGWKGAARDGVPIAESPWQVALYRDLAEGLGGMGQCEINAIYAEGRCIAAQLCTIAGTT